MVYMMPADRHMRYLRILDYVEDYINEHDVSPTFREIEKAVGFNSVSLVHSVIAEMEKEGYIEPRLKSKQRGLVLTEKAHDRHRLPKTKKYDPIAKEISFPE